MQYTTLSRTLIIRGSSRILRQVNVSSSSILIIYQLTSSPISSKRVEVTSSPICLKGVEVNVLDNVHPLG